MFLVHALTGRVLPLRSPGRRIQFSGPPAARRSPSTSGHLFPAHSGDGADGVGAGRAAGAEVPVRTSPRLALFRPFIDAMLVEDLTRR
jgi:hypothetical protein